MPQFATLIQERMPAMWTLFGCGVNSLGGAASFSLTMNKPKMCQIITSDLESDRLVGTNLVPSPLSVLLL